ncbi:MAG: DNA polymerase III subunit delta [Candidatus Methylomirabilia bacterium]
MTPDQFRREIGKGRAAPAYLFTGTETGLKRGALAALLASVPEGAQAFNVQVFHAFESEMVDVVTAARTQPFFGKRRVVVLRDIEKMRLDQAGRGELLGEYLAAPSPETVFVATTEDEAKAKTLVKQYGDAWVVVVFNPLKGVALATEVKAEAARLGCTIDGPAVAELVEVTGEDRARVFNELAKLRLAVGEGGAIDGAAVARYAAGYVHHGAFDIVDAVSRRDLPGSLRLIAEVAIKDEEFLGLLGMLGKRLRVLWFLCEGAREVPKEFRVYPGQIDKLRPDAKRFARPEIEQGLRGLALLDDRVKSTAVAPKLLLEHFLLGFLPR